MAGLGIGGVVKINLSHSGGIGFVPEKRYQLTQTIESIKRNAEAHFGTPSDHMQLKLKDDAGAIVASDMQDDKMLGYYQCKDGFEIVVVDTQENPTALSEFTDVSKVEKFEIAEEDYVKRRDNVRAFKEQCIAQQKAEAEREGIALPQELHAESYKDQAESMKEGDRCMVFPGDRLGTVRYVGQIPEIKPGYFVGVEYDEPVGKNDGSVKGKRYFSCNPNYGGFIRPENVTVGDFPPEEF